MHTPHPTPTPTPHPAHPPQGFRDSIAKNIYEALFEWLVKKLNARLAPKEPRAEDGSKYLEIGVLDIFGFEDFKVNGFEQLCINTANEQLQYFFNQNIFQWELDEYKTEGITVANITFADNREQVSMYGNFDIGLGHVYRVYRRHDPPASCLKLHLVLVGW